MHREMAPSPPKGFRPRIPVSTKLAVALRHLGFSDTDIQWDHAPPLQLRGWDEEKQDTVPPANDPEFIQILPKEDHAKKTHGRKGESPLSRVGGDTSEVAKLRRITKDTIEFRRRLLSREDGTEPSPTPRKRKIPSRPFPGSKRDRALRSSRGPQR